MRSIGNRLAIVGALLMLATASAWAQSPFLGKWGGHWGGRNESTLVVESVADTGEARGVYTFLGDSSKFRAKIKDGVLSWGDPVNSIGFEFTLLPDGTLHGERYDHGAQAGLVTMTRM